MSQRGNGLVGRKARRFADMSDRSMWARVLLHVLGVVLLILGIIGFFLPVLQGFLFTFLGLIVLAGVNPWVRRKLDVWLDGRPRMDRLYWKTALFAKRLRGWKRRRDRPWPSESEQASERQRETAAGGRS